MQTMWPWAGCLWDYIDSWVKLHYVACPTECYQSVDAHERFHFAKFIGPNFGFQIHCKNHFIGLFIHEALPLNQIPSVIGGAFSITLVKVIFINRLNTRGVFTYGRTANCTVAHPVGLI